MIFTNSFSELSVRGRRWARNAAKTARCLPANLSRESVAVAFDQLKRFGFYDGFLGPS